jgi:hypothetical protein
MIRGPYQLYWGDVHVRTELIENCPDVAQAITDMAVEALLWGNSSQRATDYVKKIHFWRVILQLLYDENVTWMKLG